MKSRCFTLAGVVLLSVVSSSSNAADRDHRPGAHHEPWRGDIHRFHDHDLTIWRSGRWIRTRRDGRLGWWWVVGNVWYHYPSPVYPFPDPYQPPVVVVPPAPVLPNYWYYCTNPVGYYPYVPRCATNWQRVVAGSPSSPPATVMAPSGPPAAPAVSAPATPQYWYYCQNPPGYYPTVERCTVNWQPVPASPPPAPSATR